MPNPRKIFEEICEREKRERRDRAALQEEQKMKRISDPTNLAIISEVYKAAERLRADAGLLACIGSWGDTLDDAEVLSMIRSWNEMGEPFIPEVVAR